MDQLHLITPPNVELVISHIHVGDPGIAAVSREVNVKRRKHKQSEQIQKAKSIRDWAMAHADLQRSWGFSLAKCNADSVVNAVEELMDIL